MIIIIKYRLKLNRIKSIKKYKTIQKLKTTQTKKNYKVIKKIFLIFKKNKKLF
jgi:hypothetical protein